MLLSEKGSAKGDIFAFGVVFWELLTNKRPWSGKWTPFDILQKVRDGETLKIPSTCPEPLKKFIQQCWNKGNYALQSS